MALHPSVRNASLLIGSVVLALAFSAVLAVPAPASQTAPTRPALAAPPDEPGAETSKRKTKKRKAYPPARLWYRVKVRFSGDVKTENSPIPGLVSHTFESSWRLASRTAVRLTLLCVNRKVRPEVPFNHAVKIRGKRRRVGGCPRKTRKLPRPNLTTTLRFGAGVDGRVDSYNIRAVSQNSDCGQFDNTWRLDEPQPLEGTIGSANSALEGIRIGFTTGDSLSDLIVHRPTLDCVDDLTGTPYSVPGLDTIFPFGDNYLFGRESYVDGELVSEHLRIAPGPRSFGRAFSVSASLEQDEDYGRPLPPAGPLFRDPFPAKSYRWTIKFKPCPGGGRKVRRC